MTEEVKQTFIVHILIFFLKKKNFSHFLNIQKNLRMK